LELRENSNAPAEQTPTNKIYFRNEMRSTLWKC